MSHIHSSDTKPERKVRKALFRLGFRYRVNVRTLPGTPDIVLAKYRTCIFVNGCFWHGHKSCKYYTVPESNTEFWVDKVRRNMERDEINNQRLDSLAWSVITIWECELKTQVFEATMERLISSLQKNKECWEQYCQHRRSNREFAREESIRKRKIREEVERELQQQFLIPIKLRKFANDDL